MLPPLFLILCLCTCPTLVRCFAQRKDEYALAHYRIYCFMKFRYRLTCVAVDRLAELVQPAPVVIQRDGGLF